MKNNMELYRGMMMGGLFYTYASSKERAVINLRIKAKKLFGFYKFSDLEKQLKDKSWTRVPF